ncbi:Fasciclin-like protein [Invertebrate iridescent virus 30]|uniref:Fasciclin-like protein n=1 Tax=Invertebrate iridescent virus 30 TaxID=345585 RepID=W8W256_9VIRU|nr:Fasciclin-like protein [Invertebrate iridescent virus 30]CCV02246.1 Fasciclin-like protein [Invertebrate iridescent virus 30]
MSFALPTITTIVDKYPSNFLFGMVQNEDKKNLPPTLWQILTKYDSFRELVRIARMEDILNDPQANLTLFIPTDLLFPRTTLKSCVGDSVEEKEILAINFELARKMVNSIIVPGILSTTMMMQSAYTKFKTRDPVNTLTTTTPHCVQFEPQTYNKPPFGIILNGKSRIVIPDILTSNGMVHTIDKFPYN